MTPLLASEVAVLLDITARKLQLWDRFLNVQRIQLGAGLTARIYQQPDLEDIRLIVIDPSRKQEGLAPMKPVPSGFLQSKLVA
jgi:hypothetical protein